ncbi:MAG TPA: DUF3568 family protein [Longimicrobiales bacterium]|nr:DUF3568 family protein [Longimicrobiales bacterium]
MTGFSRTARAVLVTLLLPLGVAACSRTTAAVAGAGAAAAAAIAYNDRGATSNVDVSVARLANATERAFRDMGITLTERKTEDDGIELKGAEGDWKVVVDIERDAGDPLSSIEVTVSKDQVNYEKSRAEEILRAILNRA